MTDAHLWAAIALAAIVGCGILLYLMARSVLPMLNALAVAEKVDERMDNRIRAILERAKTMDERKRPQVVPGQQSAQRVNPLEEIFGGAPLEPIGEMPDSEGVDVVES